MGTETSTRRTVLAALGAGATVSLAGCVGEEDGNGEDDNGGDDEATIRMLTATEASTAYAANEGLAAVVNENTDDLFVEPQPSPGTEANIGDLMGDDAEMVYVQNWTIDLLMEGEEPYDVDLEPAQVFHFYTLPWFFVTPDEDLESLADMDGDTQASPTPEGSGTAPALEHAISLGDGDFDRVSYDYGEQGSAMEEGRLDVGVGTYMNYEIEPGWQQEMGGTADYYIIEIEDETRDAWEDDPGLAVGTFPGEDLESPAGAPEEVVTPVFEYNFVTREGFDYDTVYTFLEVLYENRDELGDYHDLLGFFEDDENFVEPLFDDVPLHAAAYDFWDEQGLLPDQYERADDP